MIRIITIEREYGCGAAGIACELAARLGLEAVGPVADAVGGKGKRGAFFQRKGKARTFAKMLKRTDILCPWNLSVLTVRFVEVVGQGLRGSEPPCWSFKVFA
jgi:hypothetical protein